VKADEVEPTRRVQPWIAALLTFLGWGLGFYYARRTRTAVWLAAASVAYGLLIGAALLHGMWTGASWLQWLLRVLPLQSPWSDIIGWSTATPFAVSAWIAAARRPVAPKAGVVRLLGYLAIWLAPIVVSAMLATAIRWTLVQPFRMPSGSMQPAISWGAYMLPAKWAYGYSRYSFAPLDGFLPRGRWFAQAPQRGDVVVFRPMGETRDFVKRIVGMPGDRVQMMAGVLHINSAPVRYEGRGTMSVAGRDGRTESVATFRETLPNGVSYIVFDRYPDWELDDTRVFTVPPGHYFMLGDDRDFSQDSRTVVIGYVPFEHLVGRVDRIFEPASRSAASPNDPMQ
jgi:signal peptidase I